MIKLTFDKKEKLDVELLGSIEVDGIRYACFFCEETKEIYVYKYKIKGKKIKLIEISDYEEFKRVCENLDMRFLNEEEK